jgi:hypothetical protein
MGSHPANLADHKFGRLTAVRAVGRTGGKVVWLCRCACGSTTNVRAGSLTGGETQSCGCLRREATGDRFRGPRNGRAKQYADLRADGWSLRRIAASLGVTFQAVSDGSRRHTKPPEAKPVD